MVRFYVFVRSNGKGFHISGSTNSIGNPVVSYWMVGDADGAIGFVALLVLVLPLIDLLLRLPFFASLPGAPRILTQSGKSPVFWIFTVLIVVLPVLTYSKGTGWGSFIQPGLLYRSASYANRVLGDSDDHHPIHTGGHQVFRV